MLKSPYWAKTLMYHAVLPKRKDYASTFFHAIYQDALERQLRYCKRNYHILHPEEYIQFIEKGKSLPKRSLLITFDDGYQNIFDFAFPILKSMDIPFLVFFNSLNLDGKEWLWFSRLKAYEQRTGQNWAALCHTFQDLSLDAINQKLDTIGAPKAYQASIEESIQFDGVKIQTVKAAIQSGLLVCGGHTTDHAKLTSETAENITKQLEENKQLLEKLFQIKVDCFAYPEGLLTVDLAHKVRDIGFKAAFATVYPNKKFPKELYLFHIPRIGIFRDNFWYFLSKVHHIDQLAKKILP